MVSMMAPHRGLRVSTRAAAAAALLSSATMACRGPSALAAAHAPEAATREESCAASAVVLVDPKPRLLVAPTGAAYFLLRTGPVRLPDGVALDVTYLAADDARVATRPEAPERLEATARVLLDAFTPLAEVGQLDRVSVTALFGSPGGRGVVEQLWFARDAEGWHAAAASRRALERVPLVSTEVVRDAAEEAGARDAAAAFLSDVDRADYDSAWERSSAVVKAAMSRVAFQRHVVELPRAAREARGMPYATFAAAERFLPGATMDLWFSRATAAGRALEALQMRLDDDMVWRVAGVRGVPLFDSTRGDAAPGLQVRR